MGDILVGDISVGDISVWETFRSGRHFGLGDILVWGIFWYGGHVGRGHFAGTLLRGHCVRVPLYLRCAAYGRVHRHCRPVLRYCFFSIKW